jgi:hypothetical protein
MGLCFIILCVIASFSMTLSCSNRTSFSSSIVRLFRRFFSVCLSRALYMCFEQDV